MVARSELSIPHIAVDAEGKIRVAPDLARVMVRFEEVGEEVERVKAIVDSQSSRLIVLADECNVGKSDVSATHISIEPNREWDNERHQHVRDGVRIRREATVVLRDLSRFNQFVHGLTQIPVHQLLEVDMNVAARSEVEQQAISAAVANARSAAVRIAADAGVTLGGVYNISVFNPRHFGRVASMAPTSTETFVPGFIEIERGVHVVFEIDRHAPG